MIYLEERISQIFRTDGYPDNIKVGVLRPLFIVRNRREKVNRRDPPTVKTLPLQ